MKSLGQAPDAGELESLFRLWTIGRTIGLLGIKCRVVALRDGFRYPSHWHLPAEWKWSYGDRLRELVHSFALDDLLEVRDLNEKGDFETDAAFSLRVQSHHEIYEENLQGFLDE